MSAVSETLRPSLSSDKEAQSKTTSEADPMAANNFNKVPHFVWGLLVTILIVFGGFVAQNFYWKGQVDARLESEKDINAQLRQEIGELKTQIEYLKTYNQKTREQFAANGWTLDEDGRLSKKGK
jgi:Tfp pilus assembly protein PilO